MAPFNVLVTCARRIDHRSSVIACRGSSVFHRKGALAQSDKLENKPKFSSALSEFFPLRRRGCTQRWRRNFSKGYGVGSAPALSPPRREKRGRHVADTKKDGATLSVVGGIPRIRGEVVFSALSLLPLSLRYVFSEHENTHGLPIPRPQASYLSALSDTLPEE